MMNQIREPEEYLKLITSSESRTIKSSVFETGSSGFSGKVIYVNVDRVEDIPLPPGFISIDSLVAQYESNENRRAALEKARIELAKSLENSCHENRLSISMLRMRKGWSQRNLASKIGTSQPHIARIESGREDLRLSTIKKLANALELTKEEVISALEASSA